MEKEKAEQLVEVQKNLPRNEVLGVAKRKHSLAELLIYPDENHWVLRPQNGVLWQRTYFEWLDKWLKN